jgi:putative ABC transport system ATP-binding protein
MIKFININLNLNGRQIFHDFNFSINKGDKAAFKGRSGKGKTTLFYMLMGFTKLSTGQIFFEGEELNEKSILKIRKKIAWLPQNPNIIGRGNIKEQILLPFSFSENEHLIPDDDRLKEELAKLNLNISILDNSFEEISGGEKQRLGLMICKLLRRDVMLLDEPTSALDKENLNSVINYLCGDEEITILSASHDSEWLRNCNNIIEF